MRRQIFLVCLVSMAAMVASGVRAEVSIRELIDEAGLVEGPVAARDLKGWRKPKKMVVRDVLGIAECLQAIHPETTIIGVGTSAAAVAAAAGAAASWA